MRRAAAWLLIAALALAGCVAEEEPPPLFGPPPATESLLVLDAHRAYARALGDVWSQAFTWCGGVTGIDSSEWVEHKRIWVGEASHARTMSVTFSDLGYDAELSTITYGTPTTVNTLVDPLSGHDYVFDLRAVDTPGNFTQTDKVTLSRSRSVTVTEGVTMDLTVESDTTIEGSYAGTKLEEDIKATFGISKTKETETATAESTDVETSHDFAVGLDAGQITRIRLTAGEADAATPVMIDAVADWTATWEIGHFTCGTDSARWNCAILGQDCTGPAPPHLVNKDNPAIWDCYRNYRGHSGPPPVCSITVPLDETEAMWYGRTAAWVGLAGWLEQQPHTTANSLAAAVDPTNRRVQVTGVQHTTAEHTDLQRVTPVDPDDLDDILAGGAKLCDPAQTGC